MKNPPILPSRYDVNCLFLSDIDGDGTADLLYVHFDRVYYWLNQSGIRDTTIIMYNFSREVSKTVIPDYRSISISLNNTILYHIQSLLPEQAGLGVGTQKIAFYRVNTTYIYGPVLFEVKVWV